MIAIRYFAKVYFADAAHFIYGAELGYGWSRKRIEVPSAYGRKRYNVLGALDSNTHEVITVTNESYINSQSIIELLKKLREKNGDKMVHVVLDNAAYQRNSVVEEASKKYDIKLNFLPSYSPNLNLIERLWKFVRSICLANKYAPTFEEFKDSIDDCLSKTHTEHKGKLDTLLAHNFEVIGK